VALVIINRHKKCQKVWHGRVQLPIRRTAVLVWNFLGSRRHHYRTQALRCDGDAMKGQTYILRRLGWMSQGSPVGTQQQGINDRHMRRNRRIDRNDARDGPLCMLGRSLRGQLCCSKRLLVSRPVARLATSPQILERRVHVVGFRHFIQKGKTAVPRFLALQPHCCLEASSWYIPLRPLKQMKLAVVNWNVRSHPSMILQIRGFIYGVGASRVA
jgi:hypothetical protein